MKDYERLTKIKQFLFVEDGSIDLNLIEDLKESNPEIKVIVYRQGSRMTVIENLNRSVIGFDSLRGSKKENRRD